MPGLYRACASSHHWSRELQALGQTVRLMPLAYVKPYVKQHKNDATDAEAIFAASKTNMRFVATKTPGQQGCLTDARKQIKGRTVPQSPFVENNGARAKKLAVLPIYHDGARVNCGACFHLPRPSQEKFGYGQGAEDGVRSALLKRQRARSAHPRKAWPRVCSLPSGVAAIASSIADIDAPRAQNRARVKGGADGAKRYAVADHVVRQLKVCGYLLRLDDEAKSAPPTHDLD